MNHLTTNANEGEDRFIPLAGEATRPMKVLMTVDALGGVWRYAMNLAAGLAVRGIKFVFVGFGPRPKTAQAREAEALGELVWFDTPLDWMAADENEMIPVAGQIEHTAAAHGADILQLNLPSQAARLTTDLPVVVVSHSCVATWFSRMGRGSLPEELCWQKRWHREGFDRASAVLAPSSSHAADLRRCYGPIGNLSVVHNAAAGGTIGTVKEDFVFAAARWWDEAKNGRTLDLAARNCRWPVVMTGEAKGANGQALRISHARHTGPLPYAETMRHMRRAAIFVSPSIYEPFGLAALEAAQAGAALVLADMPTYRELWDGVAVFADPHDPDAFADAINRLIGDADLRQRYSRHAWHRGSGYLPVCQADAMFSIYENLLERSRKRPVN